MRKKFWRTLKKKKFTLIQTTLCKDNLKKKFSLKRFYLDFCNKRKPNKFQNSHKNFSSQNIFSVDHAAFSNPMKTISQKHSQSKLMFNRSHHVIKTPKNPSAEVFQNFQKLKKKIFYLNTPHCRLVM